MHCPSCHAEIPADAQFCIECGAAVSQASTDETIRLPASGAAAIACPSCRAANPSHAIFCVRCGRPMAPGALAPSYAPQQLTVPRALPAARQRRHRGGYGGGWSQASGAIFVIGLGLVFFGRLPFWPTILVVIGVSQLAQYIGRGAVFSGMRNTLWLFGLAVLFMLPKLFFPGILLLIGLTIIIEGIGRSRRLP